MGYPILKEEGNAFINVTVEFQKLAEEFKLPFITIARIVDIVVKKPYFVQKWGINSNTMLKIEEDKIIFIKSAALDNGLLAKFSGDLCNRLKESITNSILEARIQKILFMSSGF